MDKFIGSLNLRAYKPDEWVLLSPLRWGPYLITKGFITDLASIPRLARPLLDPNGESRVPAVFHDFLYSTQPVTRAEADQFFLDAMKACGIGFATRYAMYWGVRSGGWIAWNGHKNDSRADNFVDDYYWADEVAHSCGQ